MRSYSFNHPLSSSSPRHEFQHEAYDSTTFRRLSAILKLNLSRRNERERKANTQKKVGRTNRLRSLLTPPLPLYRCLKKEAKISQNTRCAQSWLRFNIIKRGREFCFKRVLLLGIYISNLIFLPYLTRHTTHQNHAFPPAAIAPRQRVHKNKHKQTNTKKSATDRRRALIGIFSGVTESIAKRCTQTPPTHWKLILAALNRKKKERKKRKNGEKQRGYIPHPNTQYKNKKNTLCKAPTK